MRKNRLLQEGREERGEEGRERGKKGIARQPCLLSESGGHKPSPVFGAWSSLGKRRWPHKAWLLSRPVPGGALSPGLDLLSALSLPCSPWQPTNEEVLLGAIQGVGA